MENEQKEADTQREAESRDCLSVPSEMGKQLQILTSQHLLQPQRNLPVLPTTGSWDLGCTEGAKAADSTAGSAKRRLVLRAGVWAGRTAADRPPCAIPFPSSKHSPGGSATWSPAILSPLLGTEALPTANRGHSA